MPRLTVRFMCISIFTIRLQWRPGLLPRLTVEEAGPIPVDVEPAMEAGTIAPADRIVVYRPQEWQIPAMEAGTIAPADNGSDRLLGASGGLQWRPGLLPRLTRLQVGLAVTPPSLQWRPGLLPRLTRRQSSLQASTIACNGGRDYCPG